MPSFAVETPQCSYPIMVERGALARLSEYIPARAGKVFFITTEDVWKLHGHLLAGAAEDHPSEILFFPGTEERKRVGEVEALAEKMVEKGGDRSSIVVAFGGG